MFIEISFLNFEKKITINERLSNNSFNQELIGGAIIIKHNKKNKNL